MCIGVSTPLFLAKPPLKSNCPGPPFRQSSHLYWLFVTPHSKTQIFLWIPKILSFPSFTPSYILKVTQFLLKISQFEFLVMTEESVLVYKLFLSLNIPNLFYFLLKNCNPRLKKSPPFFPATLLKTKVLSSLPFLKIW